MRPFVSLLRWLHYSPYFPSYPLFLLKRHTTRVTDSRSNGFTLIIHSSLIRLLHTYVLRCHGTLSQYRSLNRCLVKYRRSTKGIPISLIIKKCIKKCNEMKKKSTIDLFHGITFTFSTFK